MEMTFDIFETSNDFFTPLSGFHAKERTASNAYCFPTVLTMAADPKDPEVASAEIRQLLLHLDPQTGGGHKDRVRCLARFRNYASGEKTRPRTTPEFYDDDLPLLFLGSLVPMLDEDLVGQRLYGLLQACGSPSVEHENTLKRSARPAMALLKYLVCDFCEYDNGVKVTADPKQLNPFAFALCTLLPSQLSHMNLELHIEGDKRGGAKEDACHVISLLVTRHLADDGETTKYLPLETLLPSKAARQAYDAWLKQSAPKSLQKQVKKALEAIEAESPKKAKPSEEKKQTSPKKRVSMELPLEQDEKEDEEVDSIDAEFGRSAKRKVVSISNTASSSSMDGPVTKWQDSELAREQERKADTTVRSSIRDSQQVAAEKKRLEEEKLKLQGKDPLGLKPDLDLREIQQLKMELLEQAVKDLHEEISEERNQGDADEEHLQSLEAQKESLEHILDMLDMGIPDADSDQEEEKVGTSTSERSIIPTDSNFDALLFLTLVHRNASYDVLMDSIARLSNKTENQVMQLQNLVRDNFELFVRCADGIDIFKGASGANLETRLDNLDALAESCSDQAKKSFKPLLDNTNEVRKVQSALKVLQRVGPVVQAPHQMRQHMENGRFSQALKAYRRVLIIDEHCKIDLFNRVKEKASDAAREARRDLEKRLSQEKISVSSLLEGIQDLSELLDLDVPPDPREVLKVEDEKGGEALPELPIGTFEIGGLVINVREHPPALACLLLQAAHFRNLVTNTIEKADQNATRIYHGETLTSIQGSEEVSVRLNTTADDMTIRTMESKKSVGSTGNQWKYDVLDARVVATIRAVDVIKTWLPRLLTIGTAAREDEKRRAARVGRQRGGDGEQLTAFEVFLTNITPAISQLVDHTAFCALGSATRTSGKKVKMSFGSHSPDKLQSLLKSPLPPVQSTQCAKELAELVRTVIESSAAANGLRHSGNEHFDYNLSPLDECRVLAEEAVITVERRRCIFAFDVCARTCSSKASGSGKFDGDALLKCLHTLSEELSRPDECASEIEKGCELVVRRSCEGLASYVRDRGDSARLRAVAECADALSGTLQDVVREVEYLGGNSQAVEELMDEDILGLEGAMFDEFLDNTRENVASCCKPGWMGMVDDEDVDTSTFPAYLSAALLAIVRCRAQVEKALGNKVRRIEGMTYQFLALATAADAVAIGICEEVKAGKTHLKVKQADRLANELEFLMNTLQTYLSEEGVAMLDGTRRTLCSRAGRGTDKGGGPEGLAALEDLERLGRVYVLCLGD